MDRLFKLSSIALAILASASPALASTESSAGDQYVEAVDEFMQDSALNALFVVDTRSRTRTTGKPGGSNGDR